MKTTAFFALALAAVLLGFWTDPSQRQVRPTPQAAVMPAPRLDPDPAGAPRARLPAQPPAPTSTADTPPAGTVPGPALPASAPPGRLPVSAGVKPGDSSGGPSDSPPASPPDWREGALDLLSQIGLLCPAAGCDSLEDD